MTYNLHSRAFSTSTPHQCHIALPATPRYAAKHLALPMTTFAVQILQHISATTNMNRITMRNPILHAPLLPSSILPLPRDAYRVRKPTYPLANSSRQKERRWPLVLRFGKDSIHAAIITPLAIHTLVATLVVWGNKRNIGLIDLPNSIMPSASIVVALMLVFRNQTAYSRYWNGRLHLSTVTSAIRCLTRTILVLAPPPIAARRGSDTEIRPGIRRTATRSMPDLLATHDDDEMEERREGERRTVEVVKILIAMMYTTCNHLRNDWGVALSPGTCLTNEAQELTNSDYRDLRPSGLVGFEHRGLALTLQLSVFIESYFAYGTHKGWFNTGHLSQLTVELNSFIKSYGDMEVIRLTPIPVAHLIHHQQTLAIYCVFLAFAMASEMGWWAVPIVAFVSFTLYGIEGIAHAFEDPFGRTKIDLKMDDIFEDTRREVEVLLEVWQTQNHGRSTAGADKCRMFVPHKKKRNSITSAAPAAEVVRSSVVGKHVQWDTSEEMAPSTRTSGSVSPTTKAQMETFGARRVTWGSAVGPADKGVFSTPVFFEGVGV